MKIAAWLGFVFSASILVILALQYPFSVTFPAGSDAASHIWITRQLLAGHVSVLQYSWYPLSHILFILAALLPVSWPMRFVWWMALGHIVTGVALAFVAYRLSGWKSACVALVGWGITTTTLNRYFEDGTLAQLWSLPFLLLFLERVLAEDGPGAAAALLATTLAHPFSGVAALASVGIALPALLRSHRTKLTWWLLGVFLALTSIGLFFVVQRHSALLNFSSDELALSLHDLVLSLAGPFFVLAPVGFFVLARRTATRKPFLFIATALGVLSFLITCNNQLGGGLLSQRFVSYLLLVSILSSAVALPWLMKHTFRFSLARYIAYSFMAAVAALLAWQQARPIYAFYEAQGNYARLHPDELAAIEWLRTTLHEPQYIVSTTSNPNGIWIRSLTDFDWNTVFPTELTPAAVATTPYTYAVFFTRADHVPSDFPIVFQNKNAVIEKLR